MSNDRKFSTETIKRVYDDSERVYVEVGEWSDVPDYVELRVNEPKSIDFFGELSLTMDPEFAIQIGNALIENAKIIKDRKNDKR